MKTSKTVVFIGFMCKINYLNMSEKSVHLKNHRLANAISNRREVTKAMNNSIMHTIYFNDTFNIFANNKTYYIT